MIVRILGEGQFEVADSERSNLETLDTALGDAVAREDAVGFTTALEALISGVRALGTPLASDAFSSSDLVVPFSDATLEEVKSLLNQAEDSPSADSH